MSRHLNISSVIRFIGLQGCKNGHLGRYTSIDIHSAIDNAPEVGLVLQGALIHIGYYSIYQLQKVVALPEYFGVGYRTQTQFQQTGSCSEMDAFSMLDGVLAKKAFCVLRPSMAY